MLKLTSRESGSTQGADAMSLGSGPMGVLFLITTSCSVHRKSEPLNHGPKTLMSECECVCVCVCAQQEGRAEEEKNHITQSSLNWEFPFLGVRGGQLRLGRSLWVSRDLEVSPI